MVAPKEVTPPPSRRTFLKRGLLGGALLALGGATFTALRKGKHEPQSDMPLKAITAAAFPVLVAVAARVIPKPEHAVAVAHQVDEALSHTPPTVMHDISKVFGLLENGLAGLLTRGSATPFTLLDGAAQDAALMAWRDSRIVLLTAAYNALRKLCLGAYYADLERAREFAYPGPVFDKPDAGPIEPRGRISPPWMPRSLRRDAKVMP